MFGGRRSALSLEEIATLFNSASRDRAGEALDTAKQAIANLAEHARNCDQRYNTMDRIARERHEENLSKFDKLSSQQSRMLWAAISGAVGVLGLVLEAALRASHL